MTSITHGKGFPGVEVTNINKYGLWLVTRDHEHFISFKEFPQFLDASVSKIMKVEKPNPHLLRWPELDIDLAVESIRCFPLASRKFRPTARTGRQRKAGLPTESNDELRSAPARIQD